jgi:hypothetical protein
MRLMALLSDPPTRAPYHLQKLGFYEWTYHSEVVTGEKKASSWVLLTPKILPSVTSTSMATRVQFGFYWSINNKNSEGMTCSNFLTTKKILRPPFIPKKRKGRKQSSPGHKASSNEPPAATSYELAHGHWFAKKQSVEKQFSENYDES